MTSKWILSVVGVAVSALALGQAGDAAAFDAEKHFKGKTITIHASGAGTTSDIHSRILDIHMRKYIPGNPRFRIQNWPTGMGVPVWRAVYAAKPDGLTWGHQQLQEWISDFYLGGNPPEGFNPEKIKRIGSPNTGLTVRVACIHKEIATSWEDLLKSGKTATQGATRPGDSSSLPGTFIELLGGPVKNVYGYGSREITAVFDRKEINVTGRCRSRSASESWYDANKEPHPVPIWKGGLGETDEFYKKLGGYSEPPDVLNLPGLKYNEGQARALKTAMELSAIWRWTTWLHPDAPTDVQAVLQKAYFDVSKDPEYLKKMKAAKIDVDPPSDKEAMESIGVVKGLSQDKEAVAFYKKLIGATK